MKPSEKIKEIYKNMDKFLSPEPIAQAIMYYLDKQWEKNNPEEVERQQIVEGAKNILDSGILKK